MIDREMVDSMKAARFVDWKPPEERFCRGEVFRDERVVLPVTGWEIQKLKPAVAEVLNTDPQPGRNPEDRHTCTHMKADTSKPLWTKYGKNRHGTPRRRCPKCGLVTVVPVELREP